LLFSAMSGAAHRAARVPDREIVTDEFRACLREQALVCLQWPNLKMLYSAARMPVVFVIASGWTLRTSVRAELRELGVEALGMESADEVGRTLAQGEMPSAVVLEATAAIASDPAVQSLVQRIPTVLIASRTETLDMPPVAAVFYRPVRIGEIVARVDELLRQPRPA